MANGAVWTAGSVEALQAVAASLAALADLAHLTSDEAADGGNPLRELADSCLDGLEELARLEARTAALKVRLAADFAAASGAMSSSTSSPQERNARTMAVEAEIACVLTISGGAAGALLDQARALTAGLPGTVAALQAGSISWQHARIMVDETAGLDLAGAAALEAHFLGPEAPGAARGCPAGELVPARFRAKAKTWRERHHPLSIEKRHAKGVADRRVEYTPDRDGMAWLSAYLPAVTAEGIWNHITATARSLQGPDDARTLTQLRADVLARLTLGGQDGEGTSTNGGLGIPGGKLPSPRAQVLVTVPVFSLLGVTEEPAMLDGYGPIPGSMARDLVANGADSFYRVLVDPRDGAPLEIGRTSYRIPKAMRHWLRMRDGKCPFPGCSNSSLDNEADHLLAWHQGGTTGIANLGQPCPKHHRLKHTTAWVPTVATKNEPPGWISPSGRHYKSEHQDWEPPHWPDGTLAGEPPLPSAPVSVPVSGAVSVPVGALTVNVTDAASSEERTERGTSFASLHAEASYPAYPYPEQPRLDCPYPDQPHPDEPFPDEPAAEFFSPEDWLLHALTPEYVTVEDLLGTVPLPEETFADRRLPN